METGREEFVGISEHSSWGMSVEMGPQHRTLTSSTPSKRNTVTEAHWDAVIGETDVVLTDGGEVAAVKVLKNDKR